MQEQESPFDTFTKCMAPESRRVLDLAREEMLNLKHWWIGTEHLLWGLASEESLTSFLTPLGITPERIHAGIVFIFDRQAHQGQSDHGDRYYPGQRMNSRHTLEAFFEGVSCFTLQPLLNAC